MIVVKKGRVALFDREYTVGDVVPPAVWNRLPRARQQTLLLAGRYEAIETEPEVAPAAASGPAVSRKGRKKGKA